MVRVGQAEKLSARSAVPGHGHGRFGGARPGARKRNGDGPGRGRRKHPEGRLNMKAPETFRAPRAVTSAHLTGIRQELAGIKFPDLLRRQLRFGAAVSPALVPPFPRQRRSAHETAGPDAVRFPESQ
jgi:hypothetical protein